MLSNVISFPSSIQILISLIFPFLHYFSPFIFPSFFTLLSVPLFLSPSFISSLFQMGSIFLRPLFYLVFELEISTFLFLPDLKAFY